MGSDSAAAAAMRLWRKKADEFTVWAVDEVMNWSMESEFQAFSIANFIPTQSEVDALSLLQRYNPDRCTITLQDDIQGERLWVVTLTIEVHDHGPQSFTGQNRHISMSICSALSQCRRAGKRRYA